MSRLPLPGSDDNVWGDILNDFLSVEHTVAGVLKIRTDGTLAAKADDATVVHTVNNETIAGMKTFGNSPVVPTPTLGNQAANKTYVDGVVSSGAPDASSSTKGLVQLTNDLGGTATAPTVPGLNSKAPVNSPTFTGTVTVPSPVNATDAATKSYVDTAVSGVTPTDATTSVKGVVRLAGDLSGTASAPTLTTTANVTSIIAANSTVAGAVQKANNLSDLTSVGSARTNLGLGTAATISSTAGGDLSGTLPSPTVAKVNGVSVTGIPTSGQVITATSGTAASWSTPASAPVTSVAGKTGAVTLVASDAGAVSATGGGKETTASQTAPTGATTVDLTNGNVQILTLGASTTITLSGATNSVACSVSLYIQQDATGSRTLTWPASIKWPGGAAPVLSTAVNKVDLVVLETLDGGTTWYGSLAGADYR